MVRSRVHPERYEVIPWTLPAQQYAVDADSASYMTRALAPNPGDSNNPYTFRFPNFAIGSFACAFQVADATRDPTYSIPLDHPTWACGLDAAVPVPPGTQADPSSDHALSIYDAAANRIHDIWQFRSDGAGGYLGGSGCSSTPPNWDVGPNAANIPSRCGYVRPEEIANGYIDHALRFTSPDTADANRYRYPARHTDGPSTDTWAMPEGAWLVMDPAADLSALARWKQIIGQALKDFGAYCTDTGGTFSIPGENRINFGGLDDWKQVGVGNGAQNSLTLDLPWSSCWINAVPNDQRW